MLDFDLAALYEVETKVLNQAVKRNLIRFPEDFMFRLNVEEWNQLKSQATPASSGHVDMRSQIVTSSNNNDISTSVVISVDSTKKRADKYLPLAFTEQGVAMLSGVLHSEKAIKMNIAIMRAFVAVKRLSIQQMDLAQQIKIIKERLGGHDDQLTEIYQALEHLYDENASRNNWDNRPRIGFKP